MEIDGKDVLLFLKELFKKEDDPGNLTMRMIRDAYRKARNIRQELSREQRRVFASVADKVYIEFANAQEAAAAVKLQAPRNVAKRSYGRSSPDDDFLPDKRPRKSEDSAELSEDDFKPAKLSKKPSKKSFKLLVDESPPREAAERSVVDPIDNLDSKVEGIVKTSSYESAHLNVKKKSLNDQVPLEPKADMNSSESACSEKSKPIAEISNGVKQGNSSCSDDSIAKAESPSADEEVVQKETTSKKKMNLSKIISDEEETSLGVETDSISSDEDYLEKNSKAKDKRLRKKSTKKGKHQTKPSQSDKIKTKKLKMKDKKTKGRDANGISDGFTSDDEEPLSGFKEKETKTKKPKKTSSKDWEQDSDSDAFKKDQKVRKTEPKEMVDPELAMLKRYIREAGIRVVFVQIFKDCESMEAKKQILSSILADAGIEGEPTMEKCRNLRRQKEKMAEVSSLDPGNILGNTEVGRTRRAMRNTSPPSTVVEKRETSSDASTKKMFTNLKGIVDSEDSCDD